MCMSKRSPALLMRLVAAALLAMTTLTPATARADERLPDLKALPPYDIAMEVTADGRHLLRFSQAFANIGAGPILVRGKLAPDGSMPGYQEIVDEAGNVVRTHRVADVVFHPDHKHWHAGDIASYELRRGGPTGPVVAKNGKVSYCLVDDHQAPEYTGKYYPPQFLNCREPYFGLTAGWVDLYEADLPDQWVDVTGVPDGIYYLVVTGDPHDVYLEADDATRANNRVWVKLELLDQGRQVRVMAPDEIVVAVNGERPALPVYSRMKDGYAMAHVRLAQAMGAKVVWTGTKVIVTAGYRRMDITPGQRTALVNGREVQLPVAAFMDEGRVLVPVRFLAESLGIDFWYDTQTETVELGKRADAVPPPAPAAIQKTSEGDVVNGTSTP
jgi:hypothetical protein